MKTKAAIHLKEAATYPDGEKYMPLDYPEEANTQAERALEAASEHGYPADTIQKIQTLLEQAASS